MPTQTTIAIMIETQKVIEGILHVYSYERSLLPSQSPFGCVANQLPKRHRRNTLYSLCRSECTWSSLA